MQPRRQFLHSGSAFLLAALAVPAWADENATSPDAYTGDLSAGVRGDNSDNNDNSPVQSPLAPWLDDGVRALAFENLHTGEKLSLDYWANGDYIADALVRINYHLRDFRTGEVHTIAPELLDLLSALHRKLDSAMPFQVISGYRSAATNAMLFTKTEGVNPKSLHMSGEAIDIVLKDRSVAQLRDAAQALQSGGVGFYPHFVHVDIGPVQSWAFPNSPADQRVASNE